MRIRELKRAAGKLQIDPGIYRIGGGGVARRACRYGIAREKGKWEIICDRDGADELAVYDTEEAACEAFFRLLKSEENRVRGNGNELPEGKRDKIPEQWWITDIRSGSRSSVDISFAERTVRIPGELMADHFLAIPDEMFFLAEEDRDVWPWRLPPERRTDKLSKEERRAVMDAVNNYYRGRRDPVIFLTSELESRSVELAEQIKRRKISGPTWIARRKAAALLQREFPGLLKSFYQYQIIDAMAGIRRYPSGTP